MGHPDSDNSRALKEILAGSFGGICQVLSGQPFDTVKVRLQTQPHPPVYRGVVDCVQKTYANEGLAGFYKGMLTPLLGIGLCVSIQFATLEHMKRVFEDQNRLKKQGPGLSNLQLYLAGAASGVANSVVAGPVEHVRTRLQVQTGNHRAFNGPWDCVKKIYAANGLPGVFKGQTMTILREFQGYGAYFFTYEWLVNRVCANTGKRRDQLESWRVMGYGALSGYSLWLTVYPIDVIKSKLQTDGLSLSTRSYSSSLDCLRKTLKAESMGGLYKGFTPCMLRAAPVNALTFLGFETAINLLGRS